ncbi:unnamed protein product [Peronospora farinosa]|uniref:Uncharacterized protein n=1 Tax=Peronospora farinosa TaxID=134698 RepID=A0AAV0U3F6_9STRA|nr:unnamed protein product [Peronospora farinosa]
MKVKPQLDEAIAYLQAEIAALCAEDKDENILKLAVAVAAGSAPLPEAQFGPLLAVWTPKTSRKKELGRGKEEDRDVKTVVDPAIERVREERRRPRTRPRRRFEDFDKRDASPSASDDTLTSSPRTVGIATDGTETMKEKKMMEEVKDIQMEDKEKNEEKKDKETEENTENEENKMEVKEKKMEIKEKNIVQVVVEKEESVKKKEVKKNEVKKNEVKKNEVKKNVVKKNEAKTDEVETPMASLKALRKSMLLDVLSKIVSVAKSKDVDPAMFTLTNGENQAGKDQVDLTKIKDRVVDGVMCEWTQFSEQVYLFCQHVVMDAEQREQPEARRKGMELLHFARTLTETLRKVSMTKEATLMQKIREAKTEAAARKEEKEAACNEKAIKNDTVEESTADENHDQAMKATAFDSHALSSKTANDESLDSKSPRASTLIRKHTSIASDGTGSAARSPSSSSSRKRMRMTPVSAASASEEVSGSESHDASASEADTKLHEQSKTTKSPANRTPARRCRPLLPATRISSRQQKRRAAAAAAAAAADSTGSGNEEEHSGSEALTSVAEKEGDDANEKNEKARKVEQEEAQPISKKKKVAPKTRSRKKGWRKR